MCEDDREVQSTEMMWESTMSLFFSKFVKSGGFLTWKLLEILAFHEFILKKKTYDRLLYSKKRAIQMNYFALKHNSQDKKDYPRH